VAWGFETDRGPRPAAAAAGMLACFSMGVWGGWGHAGARACLPGAPGRQQQRVASEMILPARKQPAELPRARPLASPWARATLHAPAHARGALRKGPAFCIDTAEVARRS
jgi:hypothetical protein